MKLWKKEKKVVDILADHIDAVKKVLRETERVLTAYVAGEWDQEVHLNAEVDQLESKADKLRREIQSTLYAGAYLPNLREDISRLVDNIDKIADSAESCCDFFSVQKPDIPAAFREGFEELIHAALTNFDPLRHAVKSYFKPKGKLDELREHCAEVSKLESEVDQLEEALSTGIFASKLDLAHKMHLQQCIHAITHTSDRTEDAADILERVALKSVV